MSIMSDGSATSHTDQDSMDTEKETVVKCNQSELMKSGPSDDQHEFPFPSTDSYTVPNLNDMSSSIPQSVCSNEVQFNESEITTSEHSIDHHQFLFPSPDGYTVPSLDDISPTINQIVLPTTTYNITQTDVEQLCDDYQLTVSPIASHDESNPVSNLIESFQSILQPMGSTSLSNDIQNNQIQISNYNQATERPSAAHDDSYTMSNLTEKFPVGLTPISTGMQTNSGEFSNYYKAMGRNFESKELNYPTSNMTEAFPSIFQRMDCTSNYEMQRDLEETNNYCQAVEKPFSSDGESYLKLTGRLPLITCITESPNKHTIITNNPGKIDTYSNANEKLTQNQMDERSNINHSFPHKSQLPISSRVESERQKEIETDQPASAISSGMLCETTITGLREVTGRSSSTHLKHICSDCGKKFLYKSGLEQHSVVHTKEKPFVCDLCQTRFTQKGSLKRHMLRHEGKKLHECEECGKAHTSKANLTVYKCSHTGEKPFTCDVCAKSFLRKGSLKQHSLNHKKNKNFIN